MAFRPIEMITRRGRAPVTGNFGNFAVATNQTPLNLLVHKQFILQIPATITSITVYSILAGNVKVGVYSDLVGAPSALLSGPTASAVAALSYTTIPIAPLVVAAGPLWLTGNGSANGNLGNSALVLLHRYYKAWPYANAWPNPAGVGYTNDITEECISATFIV